jgi:integrase
MVDLRRSATKAGLKFMGKFYFHQSRATFGTSLMSIALGLTGVSVKAAIQFVRDAMQHAHESTTMRYITFIEITKAKIEAANAFSEAFIGLSSRFRDGDLA